MCDTCWFAAGVLLLLASAVDGGIRCDCSIGGVTYTMVGIQCDRENMVGSDVLCRNEKHGAIEEGYNVLKSEGTDKYESLYRLYRTARNWDEASKSCQRDGGHLAVPDSQDELLAMGMLLNTEGRNRTHAAALGLLRSTGQDKYQPITGSAPGEFLGYNWGAGQPYDSPDRRCMMLNWNRKGFPFLGNHHCAEQSAYLCERPLRPPVPTSYTFVPGVGFYMVTSTFLPYAMAEDKCVKTGGHIVVPDTQKEADTLMKGFDMFPGVERIYVGIDDRLRAGEFRTIHGGQMSWLEFQNWAPGALESRSADAHCVVINSGGSYDLVQCDLPLPTICEWPLN